MMEMINVDELNYIEEDELLSPSRQMMKAGERIVFYTMAGIWAGEIEYRIMTANNNCRKAHGLPTYHRNRTAKRRRHYSLLRQYETEHAEEMTWTVR